MKIHTATKRTSIRHALLGAAAGALSVTLAAWNAGAADFYSGKTMTLVVSAGAGGGYGLFSQLLAKHLPKYIPGEPKIILQYNGASGGLVAANHLYNVAPKDGTAIGMLRSTLPIAQVLRPSGIKYDAAKLTWIGRMTPENAALGVWHKGPVTTLAAAMDKEIVIGAGGKSGALYIYPMMVKKITGARFKIVSGYRGTNDVVLAMERGEAHGVVADYQAWKAKWGHFIKDRRIVPIFQTGMKRLKELPDVPTLVDLAKTDDERTIMRLLSAPAEIGKAISGPPGIPADRVEVLRRAFDNAIRDPELIAAAKARNVAVNPRSGAKLASLVAKALATPKPLIERTKALLEY